MTSMLVNAAFAPQPAIPASIVYKERPILQQVDAKKLAKKLLTKKDIRKMQIARWTSYHSKPTAAFDYGHMQSVADMDQNHIP